MRRLWVQQTLAFGAVIIVTMVSTVLWVNHSAKAEFRKYFAQSDLQNPANGFQRLGEYYRQHQGWAGVESLLAEGIHFGPEGIGLGAPPSDASEPKANGASPMLLLADASGRIIYSNDAVRTKGTTFSGSERANAWPITALGDPKVVGYLLLFWPVNFSLGDLELQFLERVQQILLSGAALAVSLSVIVGALLSRRLNAPLQHLVDASRAVAAGDLDRQVATGGSTEIAQVGQAFNEMTAALKQAEILRQNMVADVAHELRTPLSVLQGGLWAILNDAYPLEKAEIARLYDETRLLNRLVDDLRELALADVGQLHLNLIPVDLAQVIRRTVDTLALAAEAQELKLTAQLPAALPPVLSDPDRVAQVLRNLLINALRHTPPGGSVTVSAAAWEETVAIAITDTGEGIAAEDLPHVFERFWRADPARARSGGVGTASSTGLGLSVAQSLVTAQGGRIWAESTPGAGTVFRFTLPLAV